MACVVTLSRCDLIRVSSRKSTRINCPRLGTPMPRSFSTGQTEGVLLAHRRDVIEPVEVRDGLQVGLVLDELLGAAVQKPDMGINALHDLAIQLENKTEHAVSAGCCGPKLIVKFRMLCSAMLHLGVAHPRPSWAEHPQ